MDTANVLISVQEKLIAQGINLFLERNFDFVSAATILERPDNIKEHNQAQSPYIAIIDLDFPHIDGTDLIRELADDSVNVRVLGLTDRNEPAFLEQLVKAGAYALVLKESGMDEIKNAVQAIRNDTRYYCSEATLAIVRNEGKEQSQPEQDDDLLTDREVQILNLICEEMTNREIAEKLQISVRTVDAHRRNLLQKTDSKNTVGLVKYAVKTDLLKLG